MARIRSSEELRKRLEALNGGPLQQPPAAAQPTGNSVRSRASGKVHRHGSAGAGAGTPISLALPFSDGSPHREPLAGLPGPGRVLRMGDGGTCWLVDKPAHDGASWAEAVVERVRLGLRADLGQSLLRAAGQTVQDLDHLLFLDLETTGLGSCPLFLIGTLQWDGGRLRVRQYFARNHREERSAIAALGEAIGKHRALVTFNGRSFDAPFLIARAAACGIPLRCPPAHVDLLPCARSHFQRRLPDCKLQTLEKLLCGRTRTGDLPGSKVPAAYAHFISTGDTTEIAAILEHNALDLLTMVDLLDRVPLDRVPLDRVPLKGRPLDQAPTDTPSGRRRNSQRRWPGRRR